MLGFKKSLATGLVWAVLLAFSAFAHAGEADVRRI
jgi:hypothetical protein